MSGSNPQSTARIAGHPQHPLLIPFPIVSFNGALVTDVMFLTTSESGWATASNWLLGDDRIRRIGAATRHMIANIVVVALEAVNLVVRLTGDSDSVGGIGIWLSLLSVIILAYSGWLGGELVYRHRVGVQETRDEFSGYDDGHAEGGSAYRAVRRPTKNSAATAANSRRLPMRDQPSDRWLVMA